MENSLFILLIIVIVFIYNHLNNKIRKLENKISDLQRGTPKGNVISEIKKEQSDTREILSTPQTQSDTQSISQNQRLSEENIPVSQKDWFNPIVTFFKQNILAIIGIFTLVLGIGYFVKYAIDKNWIGELARVGIGFSIGAAILIIGHFLRKNYTIFSSIILGGGVAILYFTTTIAFREYHLFSLNTAFTITCLITLRSIVLSYYYKSEVLIIFSLVGGFLAPLMISNGTSNYVFLFTYLSVLNIGMLIIVFLKHWKSVGWVSFIFTSLYLLYWTVEKTELLSIYFYLFNYIIFYLFALQDYIRKNTPSTADILLLILINSFNTLGLVYLFNTLGYEPVNLFPIIFAVINGCLLFREYRTKNFGIHYSVFAGITISLITIAVALQFKTHLITSIWAIEATLLLFIWKKTKINIFRTCFYILFPLVIIAQLVTWSQYFTSKQLTVIFNPLFLTSTVTIITTLFNLVLFRQVPESDNQRNVFFESLFKIFSYAIIYFALLFEMAYQLSGKPFVITLNFALLLSIYYSFILLLLSKKMEMSEQFKTGFAYIVLLLIAAHVSVYASELISSIISKEVPKTIYGVYLLYLIPFIYLCWRLLPQLHFFTTKLSYWMVSCTIIMVISYELYHGYMLGNVENISNFYPSQKHFSILYLPIIWAVLASAFIYMGLKKDLNELSKIGFTLIAVMIVKLYAYDVWKMDNISRIIAFILLGVILLLSSFMFQRLKNIIRNLVEKKEENIEHENLKS
ncbi:beta-carotene 15,15'-monooxygenase [Chryseobacterium piperi]|uniref:Beta-carotene 15,15'-monooxygenase n=1 Tax=Chryseobacterium piperi TaxID=558152 RepID=A0A086B7U6_9FLAO|nr:DUF2339 domain-containing protein [Chryseobacterium piperi]ATL75942.1 DUF2339 domain-containing protein [Chryseobacterium piperi]KFF25010.1 beta-carotene 15,15'-monooxygenase [Chryseobacterium piperi]